VLTNILSVEGLRVNGNSPTLPVPGRLLRAELPTARGKTVAFFLG
jgi:hypothetical protein